MMTRAGNGIVPVQRPLRTWQFTAAFIKRDWQAGNAGDSSSTRIGLVSAPAIDGIQQGRAVRLIKLIRRIAPGLEQAICQQGIANQALPQWAGQDALAP